MDTIHQIQVLRVTVRNIITMLLALAAVCATTAAGLPPQTTIVAVDTTFTNDFDCSFALQEQVHGAYRDTQYVDRDGTLTREFVSPQFQGPLTVTWTNPATGKSLSSHEASTLIVSYNPDG